MSGYHECVFICHEGITENAKKQHHQAMERVWNIEANKESDRQHGKQGPDTRGGQKLGGQEGSTTSKRKLGRASRRMLEGQNETLCYNNSRPEIGTLGPWLREQEQNVGR